MKIKIYSDGAEIDKMLQDYNSGVVSGFTTNPTLMKTGGVTDYLGFAKEVLSKIKDLPISFEVFSDNIDEMEEQAYKLRDLAENVYIKIPVQNTQGESTCRIIKRLSNEGVKLNITAIFSENQILAVHDAIDTETPSVISIFAGRIANAGVDPEITMKYAVKLFKDTHSNAEILWASTREVFNAVQAERCGCHIITMTPNFIKALGDFGKDLDEFSRETVQMFYDDAIKSGFNLNN